MDDDWRWSEPDTVSVTSVPEDENITEPIENTAPSIRITYPSAGDVLAGWVNITWTASDSDGDTILSFWIDITDDEGRYRDRIGLISEDVRSFRWNTSIMTNGSYIIIITASDGYDNSMVSSGLFTIRNEMPADENNIEPINETGDDDDSHQTDPEDDPTDGDDKFHMYKLIIVLVIVLVLILILFGIGKRIYDRTSDDDRDLEE
jgi:hypothetical protein